MFPAVVPIFPSAAPQNIARLENSDVRFLYARADAAARSGDVAELDFEGCQSANIEMAGGHSFSLETSASAKARSNFRSSSDCASIISAMTVCRPIEPGVVSSAATSLEAQ